MRRSMICMLATLVAGVAGPNLTYGDEGLVAAQTARAPGDARGFVMRLDGIVVGRITTVDPSTFNLIPLPGATVTFLQNRRVMAQGRTAEDGTFAIQGLTPWALYSVVVRSADSVGAAAIPVRPDGPTAEAAAASKAGGEPVSRTAAKNEIQ